jgi:Tetratricopeptide repeat
MLPLVNVLHDNAIALIATQRKAHTISATVIRKTTAVCISKIAGISEAIVTRSKFIFRGMAMTAIASTQRQARWERPSDRYRFFERKEVWTSHSRAMLCSTAVDCVEFFYPMAESDRLTMLTQFLEQNPGDAFARYGLAMEYSKAGNTEQALAEFGKLLQVHPDYTNGYFMAAQTLERAGRSSEAKKMLESGIEAAKRTGNKHALSEMSGMLEELHGN